MIRKRRKAKKTGMTRRRAGIRADISFETIPSHFPFERLIDCCIRGHSNPELQSDLADDHIAELCLLLNDDIDEDFWLLKNARTEGRRARELIESLADRATGQNDERAANLLYSIATQAAFEVLNLYLRHREMFDRIAPRRKLLPCLSSIHPHTQAVTARMRRDARLGEKTEDAFLVGSRSWFTKDAPANVYARAIIASVAMNQELEPVEVQQASWKGYERKHGCQVVVEPPPKYLNGIDRLPVPITPAAVLAYWRKGKEMIIEEMPEFHDRPEWRKYCDRHYANGAKAGAIQHAIFKDILTALRTIAGANKCKASAVK